MERLHGDADGPGPFAVLRTQDPDWAKKIGNLAHATVRGALSAKQVALVNLAINASPTHFDPLQARRHIRNALDHGAPREEVLAVLKLSTAIPIHSFAIASPILEKSLASRNCRMEKRDCPTPTIDGLRRQGGFNQAWEHIAQWEPQWLDAFLAVGLAPWADGAIDAKTLELLCIAFDCTVTHLYAPGIARHIEIALALGIPAEQILEVLKIVSSQGLQSVQAGLAILEEETNIRQ